MRLKTPLVCLTAASLALFSCQKTNPFGSDPILEQSQEMGTLLQSEGIETKSQLENPYAGQQIIVFQPNTFKTASLVRLDYEGQLKLAYNELEAILSSAGLSDVEPLNLYINALEGFAAEFTPAQLAIIRQLPFVDYVEDVIPVSADGTLEASATNADQVPYGIARVGGAQDGTGKRAWVIDSGIDSDHEDLNVNTELSKGFTGEGGGCGLLGLLFGCPDQSEPTFEDGDGHGTHVAGTIGAKDNGIGVVGVAAGADLVAIKVLSDLGTGSNAGVIQGVDYVAATADAGDVANLSLGGGTSTALDNAVRNLGSKGVFVTLAAGNDSQNANNSSPARANGTNVFTVSAMDSQDRFASYSNFGNPPVDFCAPGSSVYSTHRNNGYATLSGTSMAAPHLAGILLMTNGNPKQDGVVRNDPDGNADPIAVL